jgi:hypothetical protein
MSIDRPIGSTFFKHPLRNGQRSLYSRGLFECALQLFVYLFIIIIFFFFFSFYCISAASAANARKLMAQTCILAASKMKETYRSPRSPDLQISG